MFAKDLYRHSKLLFCAVFCFIAAFLFLNLKWGIVASPIYQYGMFSGKALMTDTIVIFHIEVNNRPVDLAQLSFPKRDKIVVAIDRYRSHNQVNQSVFNTMQSVFNKANATSLLKHTTYTNNITVSGFSQWLKERLYEILHEKINTLHVYSLSYAWKNGQLHPVDSLKQEILLAAY